MFLVKLFLLLFSSKQCIFIRFGCVSVSVISLGLGSDDNTYLDLYYSGYHKNLIQ